MSKVTLVLSSAGWPGHSQPCITSHLTREPFQGAPASRLCPLSVGEGGGQVPLCEEGGSRKVDDAKRGTLSQISLRDGGSGRGGVVTGRQKDKAEFGKMQGLV